MHRVFNTTQWIFLKIFFVNNSVILTIAYRVLAKLMHFISMYSNVPSPMEQGLVRDVGQERSDINYIFQSLFLLTFLQ